jgi:hypothetical protein
VAYAEVGQIMSTPLRQKLKTMLPMKQDGQQKLQDETGINIETDIDRIVAALVPSRNPSDNHPSGIVLARGRFDQVKIEALMREHGARVETYKDLHVIVADTARRQEAVSVAFLGPGLVAIGSPALIHSSIDLKSGGASVFTNDDLMSRIRELGPGSAWAVARFDVLASNAQLPQGLAQNLPAVSWLSASATIDSGVRAKVYAEARDDDAANALRDVIRGIVAFARMQTAARPELQTFLQTLDLGGSGKTVTVAFDAPAEVIETLGSMLPHKHQNP